MILVIPGLFRKKEYYEILVEKLQEAGFDAEIIDLGRNVSHLEQSGARVLERMKSTSEKDDIIAHSFGGIILKHLLHHYPEVREQIKSITFVSVPHGGSWQALFVSMAPAARELLPFRKHVRELSTLSLPEATLNFISEKELKVYPRKGGLLKAHTNIVIPDTDHDSIVRDEHFISKATEFINSNYDRIFL